MPNPRPPDTRILPRSRYVKWSGLVNHAVPLDKLMKTAREMAAKIAENSPFSIKMIKRGLNMARDGVSLDALMDYETEACLACVFTKERQESLKKFEERKK
jgi:enoyl-CoA hydratase